MKRENEYVDSFRKIGLTESESKVYINLLRKQNFTATEISKLAGISRSKIYEILRSLIDKGLCVEILGKTKKYSPVNPEIAFENLLERYQQECYRTIEQKRILIDNIMSNLTSLYLTERNNTDPLDYIEVIHDDNRLANRIRGLEKLSKKEILSFSKAPYAMNIEPDIIKKHIVHYRDNIVARGLYEISDAQQEDFFKVMKLYEEAGEQIKLAVHLPLKLHVFDEKIVIFCLENKFHRPGSTTSMVIEHVDLAKTLKEIFKSYWQSAMTLDEFENEYIQNNQAK